MKNNLIMALLIIAAGAGGFFGGMKYQQSQVPSRGDFQARMGLRQGTPRTQPPAGAQAVRGEIISQDEESITVKLPDDSTKIVLLSENTKINKTTQGSTDDLETGKQIMVFGQENSDKSISATNIQLDFGFREGMRGE